MKTCVFDLEADGLSPTKIYCVSFYHVEEKRSYSLTDYDEIKKEILSCDYLIGHYIVPFDLPVLARLLGIEGIDKIVNRPSHLPKVIDTYGLSLYLFQSRRLHGLESWGEFFGVKKPEIEDWENLSIEEYLHRCQEDVKINTKLWKLFRDRLFEIYGMSRKSDIKSLIDYLNFKLYCLKLQEDSGWLVDVERCNELIEEYSENASKKKGLVEQHMPQVPVYSKRTKPKVFYRKDNTLSKKAEEWIALCKEYEVDPITTEELQVLTGHKEPNAGSSDQLKEWLFSMGWKPDHFKESKSSVTGEVRRVPQINKDHGGGLTDSVLELAEEHPVIMQLEDLGVLDHRVPQIKKLLENMDENNRVVAGASGFTNTLRLKHRSPLVNLPKSEKKFAGIRSCLMASAGKVCLGSDMSSLEDKLKQHFIWPYDQEYVKSMQTEGYDPHLELAKFAGAIDKDDILRYNELGDKEVKKVRGVYKNGNYACQYGAMVPRLMITIGCSEEVAQKVFDAYWGLNWAIKEIQKSQEVKEIEDGTLWLYNPVAGFYFPLKKRKDIFSTLVQGTAAYSFDMWLGFVLNKRPQVTAQFHDEFVLEIKEGYEEHAKALVLEAIQKTNKALNLNVELGVDVQFGKRYSEIH